MFVKTLAPQGSGDGDGKWSAEETRPEGRRVVGGRMRPQKADHAAYMRSRRAAQRGDGLPVNIRVRTRGQQPSTLLQHNARTIDVQCSAGSVVPCRLATW